METIELTYKKPKPKCDWLSYTYLHPHANYKDYKKWADNMSPKDLNAKNGAKWK